MNVVKNVANILKLINRKGFISKYALPHTNKKVMQLKKIEDAVKHHYNINTNVIYVSIKHKSLLVDERTKGYYSTYDDCAVIFIGDDYKRDVTTLCHELTHAYQNIHMNSEYKKSTRALHEGKVTYAKAWHEVHARTEASIMCEYFLNKRVAA